MWVYFVSIGMILLFIVLPVGWDIWLDRKNEKAEFGKKSTLSAEKEEKKQEEFEKILYIEDKPFLEPKVGTYPKAGAYYRIIKDVSKKDPGMLFIGEGMVCKRLAAPPELVAIDKERIQKALELIKKALIAKSLWLYVRVSVMMSNNDVLRLRSRIAELNAKVVILKDVKELFSDEDEYISLVYIKLNWENLTQIATLFNWEYIDFFMLYDDWNPALFTQRDALCAAQQYTYKISWNIKKGLNCNITTDAFNDQYLHSERKQWNFAKALNNCFLKNVE